MTIPKLEKLVRKCDVFEEERNSHSIKTTNSRENEVAFNRDIENIQVCRFSLSTSKAPGTRSVEKAKKQLGMRTAVDILTYTKN